MVALCRATETCVSRAGVEPTDRSKNFSMQHRPSRPKAVGNDGTPRNQSTTRNHTASSFRVKQTLHVPPSLPWACQTRTDHPLPASCKTTHGDCTSTGGSAVAAVLFRERPWRNDCHPASTMSKSLDSSSSGALRHVCIKSESILLPLSALRPSLELKVFRGMPAFLQEY